MMGLLQKDPNQRLTWPHLLNHPFVKEGILIRNEEGIGTPLTNPLTSSQAMAKENQKRDLASRTTGQSKILARVVQKIDEQEIKLKLLQKKTDNVKSIKSTESSKASIQVLTGDLAESQPSGVYIQNSSRVCRSVGECSRRNEPLLDGTEETKCSITLTKVSVAGNGYQAAAGNAGHLSDQYLHSSDSPGHFINRDQCEDTIVSCSGAKEVKNAGELTDQLQQLNLTEGNPVSAITNSSKLEKNEMLSCLRSNHSRELVTGQSGTAVVTLHNWDSTDNAHPIENDEWLAFLQRTMEEVMEGDVDSMLQQSFVGIIVLPLRNPNANCRVIEYVACLLSLPFVSDGVLDDEMETIMQVYLEVKVVPNLVYASKLLARNKGNLSADELQALECIYLLLCHLTYSQDEFIIQFCDTAAILNAASLLQQFFLLGRRKVRVVTDLVAILCQVLRVLPENASVVEQIVLGKGVPGGAVVDLASMLTHHSPVLRTRLCALLRLLGRFSCSALQPCWSKRLRENLVTLMFDSDEYVREAAEWAVLELKQLPFYDEKRS